MATVKATDYAATFGKLAVELGEAARKGWTQDVWQPLGIKDRTATQRANSNGEGGTRSAMLAVMAHGFTDMALATRAAAYIRHRYLGNTSTGNGGITYAWFTAQVNMATVASNAQFGPDSKGTMRLAAKARAKVATPSKPKVRKATPDSVNGPVTVVRQADKVVAEAEA